MLLQHIQHAGESVVVTASVQTTCSLDFGGHSEVQSAYICCSHLAGCAHILCAKCSRICLH